MSEWEIELVYVDGSSKKFWRGRTDGSDYIVAYGRIGTDGQSKTKTLASPEQARDELEKAASSKRKKGYVDDPASAGPSAESLAEVAEGPTQTTLELERGGQTTTIELRVDGNVIETLAREPYSNEGDARSAFERITQALHDEGYRPA